MAKTSAADKKLLKQLTTQLKELQEQLVQAHKREGIDAYIDVRVGKNQARFQRIRKKGAEDKAEGNFYIEVSITAKQQEVLIPVSVASGKKTAGFMYQIEGSAEGSIVTTDIKVRGESVSQITVGTLLFAKIPTGKTALFQIQATTGGAFGKSYKIVFTRLNYKLKLTDVRYLQYLKEIASKSVIFS